MDKIQEMTLGEKVLGGSGILLLLLSFFTWFSKDYSAGSDAFRVSGTYNGHNGWGGILSLLGILLVIAAVVFVVLDRLTSVELPEKFGNFPRSRAVGIGAIVGGALCLLQILVGQSVSGVSLDRTIWAWIALLASAGVAAGGVLMMTGAAQAPEQPPAV